MDWKWCKTCETAYISCDKCHNTTCNGSGCEYCLEIFGEAQQMIKDGIAPTVLDFPTEEVLPFFYTKEKKDWDEEQALHEISILATNESQYEIDLKNVGLRIQSIKRQFGEFPNKYLAALIIHYQLRIDLAWSLLSKEQQEDVMKYFNEDQENYMEIIKFLKGKHG